MYDINRDQVGLILRAYARQRDGIASKLNQTKRMVEKALETGKFKRIDILIWNNPEHPDSDCGKTAKEYQKAFANFRGVIVTEVKEGDVFCSILNYGIALQLRHGIEWSMIASDDCHSYFTEEILNLMLAQAMSARVVGLAINELTESIQKGRVANTFALWHNMSLLSVGAFDLRAQKPANQQSANYKRGFDGEGERFYHLAGVEEIIPLLRMVDLYGRCIGVVTPKEGGTYIIPDPKKDPDRYKQHVSKMATKYERMVAFASAIGFELSFLEGGLIK